jgi:hypothetical protein
LTATNPFSPYAQARKLSGATVPSDQTAEYSP